MIKMLKQFIAPLQRRVFLMIARGIIKNVNDDTELQHAQVALLKNELRNDVERFQQYGFTSVPKIGAEAIALFLNGNRDHGIIISVEDRQYRMKGMENGEVALYTDEGDFIHFQRGNKIEISTETLEINASTKVEVNTPIFDVNASNKVDIDATIEAEITGGIVDIDATTNVAIDAGTEIALTAPDIELNGNLAASGSGGGGSASLDFATLEADITTQAQFDVGAATQLQLNPTTMLLDTDAMTVNCSTSYDLNKA